MKTDLISSTINKFCTISGIKSSFTWLLPTRIISCHYMLNRFCWSNSWITGRKKNKMRFILRKKIVANNRTKDDLIQDSIV